VALDAGGHVTLKGSALVRAPRLPSGHRIPPHFLAWQQRLRRGCLEPEELRPKGTATIFIKPSDADTQPVVVSVGADVNHVRGVALAAIHYKYGGVVETVGTRGTPKCTASVCYMPSDADEQPGFDVGGAHAVYVSGVAPAAIKYKYGGVAEVVVAGGAEVVRVLGVALAAINSKYGGVVVVVGTRGTPKCTASF